MNVLKKLDGWLEVSVKRVKLWLSGRLGLGLFTVLCFVILALNFAFNMFSFAPGFWSERFDRGSESRVLAGLIYKNTVNGGPATLGLYTPLGYQSSPEAGLKLMEDQYLIYEGLLPFSERLFEPYTSQAGFQLALLAPIENATLWFHDKVTTMKYFSESARASMGRKLYRSRLNILRTFVALCNALVITAFCAWFFAEIGPRAGLASLAVVLAGGWMTVYGSNLYWMLWTFFLPTVVLCWGGYVAHRYPKSWGAPFLALVLFGLAIYVKCLMGYEFISTICISACVPIVYYWVLSKRSVLALAGRLFLPAVFALGAFALALLFHARQMELLASVKDVDNTIMFLVNKHLILPVDDSAIIHGSYASYRSFNLFLLLAIYIFSPIGQHGFYLPAAIPLLFGISAAVLVLRARGQEACDGKLPAIAIASLFSLLAPLSWFVLAKVHAAQHFYLCGVLWYVPTVFWLVVLVVERYCLLRSR